MTRIVRYTVVVLTTLMGLLLVWQFSVAILLFLFLPKLKLSLPYFRPAVPCGAQMGEARRGPVCRANKGVTLRPSIKP